MFRKFKKIFELKIKNSKLKAQSLKLKADEGGQFLIELLLGVAIGAIIIIGISVVISSNLKSAVNIKTTQIASSSSQDLLDAIKSKAESDWRNIYDLSKGSLFSHYISSSTQSVMTGFEAVSANGRNFARYFYVDNVSRDKCGIGDISANATSSCMSGPGTEGIADDPSTQKITVIIKENNAIVLNSQRYITRSRNFSFVQIDWSGGGGQEGPVNLPNDKFLESNNLNFSNGEIRLQLP